MTRFTMDEDITAERPSATDAAPPDERTPHRGPQPTTRRRYLVGAAAVGVAGAAGAYSAPARAETFADEIDAYSERFGTIVDVTEAGADDTGGTSITKVVNKQTADDTLLVFPPGEYFIDDQVRFTGYTNFGMVGNDATLVPADVHDYDGPKYRMFRFGVQYRPGRDLLFEGFTIDQTADDTGVRVLEAFVEDGLEVRDVTVLGQHDSGAFGPALLSVTEPDGSGVVERFEAADGAAWVDDTPDPLGLWRGPTGILLSGYHRGTMELRDCVLGGFPDNGLYGCTNGTVRVVGGHYENSNAASIRLGGTECVVRGATITVDENPAHFRNQRGIRLDDGANCLVDDVTIDLSAPNGHALSVLADVEYARIQNTTVTIAERVNHGIVVSPGAGPAHIFDTDVVIHGGGNAIQIGGTDEGPVVCKGVRVWGQASGAGFRHAIRCNRNDCEFRKIKVWQPGPDYRRGIVFNGDDCLLYDAQFKTRHHPVWVNGDGAWMEANTLESYDDYAAIRLNDRSSTATIKENTLYNGVLDLGCDGLRMYGNVIE